MMEKRTDYSKYSPVTKQRRTDDAQCPSSFPVGSRNKYSGGFPYLRRPVEIGSFSLDDKRDFHHDRSQLRYFIDPRCSRDSRTGSHLYNKAERLSLNLRDGYDICINRDESIPERIDTLLRWVLLNRHKFIVASETAVGSNIDNEKLSETVCSRRNQTGIVDNDVEVNCENNGSRDRIGKGEDTVSNTVHSTSDKVDVTSNDESITDGSNANGDKMSKEEISSSSDHPSETGSHVNFSSGINCSSEKSDSCATSSLDNGELSCTIVSISACERDNDTTSNLVTSNPSRTVDTSIVDVSTINTSTVNTSTVDTSTANISNEGGRSKVNDSSINNTNDRKRNRTNIHSIDSSTISSHCRNSSNPGKTVATTHSKCSSNNISNSCIRKTCDSSSSSHKPNAPTLCTDFICWRGLLTKLLCTPFERREGWCLVAAKFNGTIYLCDWDIKVKDTSRSPVEEERERVMTYGGVKFEQYVTSESPFTPPNTAEPVNTNKAFVSVVRTRLEQHSLVFGGEVDCCDVTDHKKYIELKTSRIIDNQRQMNSFKRFKLLKWWAQSFLIGISEIVCGFRDDSGVVRELQNFRAAEIPKFCEDAADWSADVAFNFLNAFLQHIKRVVEQDHDRALYVFYWQPFQPITCTVVPPDSDYAFLPDWYINESLHSETEGVDC